MFGRITIPVVAAAALFSATLVHAEDFKPLLLKFGKDNTAADMTFVPADAVYNTERGYGFEPSSAAGLVTQSRCMTGNEPFLFSIHAPEGNYRVTAWFGGATGGSDTAIKAESRRIMMPLVAIGDGEVNQITFTVNIRTPKIDDKTSVKLNDRETKPDVHHWDDKLTLEFAGTHPAISALKIERVTDATTVFLVGDSTVTDQPGEPWAAWGQLIPQFFKPSVAVANYAESGRTFKSFTADRRWDKVMSVIKPGDYVFIQFGHNDMKEKGAGIGPYTSFSDSMRKYIADTRAKGAFPVVCTPMHRRKFAGNEIQPTFGDYPDAVRKLASETSTPLIDLQAMSKPLYEYFGPEKSKRLFVHFPAGTFPGQDKALADDTHFQAFGADQIARCVVQRIRDLKLPLAKDLRDGIPAYDPSHPDDPDAYTLPASAGGKPIVPEGK